MMANDRKTQGRGMCMNKIVCLENCRWDLIMGELKYVCNTEV